MRVASARRCAERNSPLVPTGRATYCAGGSPGSATPSTRMESRSGDSGRQGGGATFTPSFLKHSHPTPYVSSCGSSSLRKGSIWHGMQDKVIKAGFPQPRPSSTLSGRPNSGAIWPDAGIPTSSSTGDLRAGMRRSNRFPHTRSIPLRIFSSGANLRLVRLRISRTADSVDCFLRPAILRLSLGLFAP